MASVGRERGSAAGVVGVLVLVLVLVALLAVVVVMTFSVTVSGHSMEPTLHQSDRLEVNLLHRHDINRFDVVEATEPGKAAQGGGVRIVKRVIGLPGDRVAVEGGDHPTVFVRPARTNEVFKVDNPTWPGQVGDDTSACCKASGENSGTRAWVTVPADSYWLIGDNWGGSTDSRVFGFAKESGISAKLSFRILPRDRFGKLPQRARLVPTP